MVGLMSVKIYKVLYILKLVSPILNVSCIYTIVSYALLFSECYTPLFFLLKYNLYWSSQYIYIPYGPRCLRSLNSAYIDLVLSIYNFVFLENFFENLATFQIYPKTETLLTYWLYKHSRSEYSVCWMIFTFMILYALFS